MMEGTCPLCSCPVRSTFGFVEWAQGTTLVMCPNCKMQVGYVIDGNTLVYDPAVETAFTEPDTP